MNTKLLHHTLIVPYLALLLSLCLCLSALPVHAEPPPENNKEKDSEADITFEENTGPTKPVDPENPENPDPEAPDVSGSLVILTVSSFTFRGGKVSLNTEEYPLVTTNKPNIQIADLRGNASGWSLDATVSPFVDQFGEESLKGSVINITGGRLNSLTSMELAPIVNNDVKLPTTSVSRRILTAFDEDDNGLGSGLWIDRWYPEEGKNDVFVYLEVPAGAATVEKHTATITWTLGDTP